MSRASTLATVSSLKEHNQDFEFYPTTDEQIQCIKDDLTHLMETHEFYRGHDQEIALLDVGAGDGRVLLELNDYFSHASDGEKFNPSMFAIEKSSIHSKSYRGKGISVIGTDFHETNFVSKNACVAYCNPPYTEFSEWADRLITQLNFKLLYMVVPKRWADDISIQAAIEARGVSSEVIAESDFLNADRQARGEVELVRFSITNFNADTEKLSRFSKIRKNASFKMGFDESCPFQLFLDKELGLKATKNPVTNKFREAVEATRIRKELSEEGAPSREIAVSRGVLWALLDSYDRDLTHVLTEYKAIAQLDANLLSELGVEYDEVFKSIKAKLFGFRNVYWGLLFDELDTLTERLTADNKTKLLNTLKANSLDFTYTNAIYIVDYAVTMTNELIEDSLINVHNTLTSEKAISRYYKSNMHVYKDNWRHLSEEKAASKYMLDYRFVHTSSANFHTESYKHGINENARDFTNNLRVAFKLLGYRGLVFNRNFDDIEMGETIELQGITPQGKQVVLVVIRYHKNGNKHLRFNQEAMMKFNVTLSRLLGWVRDKDEFDSEVESKKPTKDEIWSVGDNLKVKVETLRLSYDNAA